jgi:DNA-binding MarR family transcriptional regulator
VAGDGANERLVPALLSISKSMRALQGIKLASLGFHNGQDELLMAIDTKGETVSIVAEHLSIRPSTVSKMMDRLVAKGLVERIGDARDGRRTLIRITPAGIEARKMLVRARSELDSELASAMNADRCAEVTRELEDFAQYIASRLRRLR